MRPRWPISLGANGSAGNPTRSESSPSSTCGSTNGAIPPDAKRRSRRFSRRISWRTPRATSPSPSPATTPTAFGAVWRPRPSAAKATATRAPISRHRCAAPTWRCSKTARRWRGAPSRWIRAASPTLTSRPSRPRGPGSAFRPPLWGPSPAKMRARAPSSWRFPAAQAKRSTRRPKPDWACRRFGIC
jgi:hypothetical protein